MKKKVQRQTAEEKSRIQQQQSARVPAVTAAAIPRKAPDALAKISESQPAASASHTKSADELRREQRLRRLLFVKGVATPRKTADELRREQRLRRMSYVDTAGRTLRLVNAIRFVAEAVACHAFEGVLDLEHERREWGYESMMRLSALLDRQPLYLRKIGTAIEQFVEAESILKNFVRKHHPEVIEFERKQAAERSAVMAK